MSLEENKAVVRRWIEEVWTQGNLDVVDELIYPDHDHTALHRHHPDYDQGLSDAFHGPEGQKALLKLYRSAFPDMQFTVDQEIAEGDLVVNVAIGRMTHRANSWASRDRQAGGCASGQYRPRRGRQDTAILALVEQPERRAPTWCEGRPTTAGGELTPAAPIISVG